MNEELEEARLESLLSVCAGGKVDDCYKDWWREARKNEDYFTMAELMVFAHEPSRHELQQKWRDRILNGWAVKDE
jgi:hypothetical protein